MGHDYDAPNSGFAKTGWTEDGWEEPHHQSIAGGRPLTSTELELRTEFVKYYLFDYSPVNAAIRCGYIRSEAKKLAERFMDEPVVLQMIQEKKRNVSLDPEGDYIEDAKRQVMNTLIRESNNYTSGTGTSRTAAATNLAKLMGMEPEKTTNVNMTGGSCVMQVPMIADISGWEEAASKSQAKLVEDTQEEHDDQIINPDS